jgi:hypothetical protein
LADCIWRFFTEREIVIDVLSSMTKEDKEQLRAVDGENLSSLDSSVGAHIRSYYRLMENNNPYVEGNAQQMSMRIVGKVWSILTGKEVPAPPVVEEQQAPNQKDWIYFYGAGEQAG